MFVTVFPPVIDALLAVVGLSIVVFSGGVFSVSGVGLLMDRLAPSPFDPTSPAELAAPSVPIGVLEEEVTP